MLNEERANQITLPEGNVNQYGDLNQPVEVDGEITFNLKKNQGSTSSEDQLVDTSDDLMNVDCDQFIADCATQAERRRLSHDRGRSQQKEREGNPYEKCDDMIKRADRVEH